MIDLIELVGSFVELLRPSIAEATDLGVGRDVRIARALICRCVHALQRTP